MGITIDSCKGLKGYIGNISIPCCDYFNEKNMNQKIRQDSIVLPKDNNMNLSYNKNNLNQNNEDEAFNISLSPLSKSRKINIKFNQMNINYDSSNNKYNSSNNETNKIYEPIKFKKENEPAKEHSFVKEESYSEEENDSNSNEEYNMEELIKEFDNKIINFAEYISEEQFDNLEKSIIKEIENNLEEFNINSEYSNNINFERPPLLFKSDNSVYKGSWNKNGEKDGFGIFFDKQGNKYVGEWENDKFNGKGRLISISGDYYEGYFNMGIIEGYGIFYSNNEKYEYNGEFQDNKFHGKGIIKYENNNIIYEGEFNNGYKHGFGKLIFNDKSYYEGNFEKNNFNGKGTFFFKNGKIYRGEWKNNKMDGEGNFDWGDGTKYKGEYKNNMREGNGVYTFGCNLYDGAWVNGIPHGKGILLYEGLKIIGIFRYGKILDIIEGKGANRELTEKYTIDSKANYKFEDTFKDTIDSRIISGKEI